MMTKNQFKKLLLLFVVWRVGLFLIGIFAPFVLHYDPSFPYATSLLPLFGVPQWLYSWANFDGVHYLTIAEKGYLGTGSIQAFFPLFPAVILHSLKLVFGNSMNLLLAGLLISNLATFGFCVVWFALIKKLKNEKIAWWSLLILLFFPTSFFMGALYTEALFLLLVVSVFYFAEKKWWRWAALFTILASATRVVGILLVPALLIELWQQEFDLVAAMKKIKTLRKTHQLTLRKIWLVAGGTFLTAHWGKIVWLLAGSLGTLFYMAYLQFVFHDPLYFAHVQASFGAGRTTASLVSYPQVIFRYLKILATARPFDLKYIAYVQEFIAGTVGFVVLLLCWRKVRASYFFFALGAFIVPTLTGTFSSMPRYILVCLPIYVFLAELLQKRSKIAIVYLLISTGLLFLNIILFIQGYWVA